MNKQLLIIIGTFAFFYFLFQRGGRMAGNIIDIMAEAIKTFEGWWPGSRSQRNNNPGNLKFRAQPGAIGADEQGHAIFNSYESGWNALLRQLNLAFSGRSSVYSPSMSLYDFFGRYAEGNSDKYAQYVAAKLGVPPETTLQELIRV